MGRFTTFGDDDIVNQMKQLGELSGETATKMLLEGADITAKQWQTELGSVVESHTGGLVGSPYHQKTPTKTYDGIAINVYPKGTHSDGKRNAEIGFILNYCSRYPKQNGWAKRATDRSERLVKASMEKIWADFISKISK